jgi:predicted nucleic acid-binding protein
MNRDLKQISRLYLDTNIFIYFMEENAHFADRVARVFELCEAYNIELFTSEITVTECLVGAYKKKNTALIEKYEAFFKSVSEAVNIVPVDSHILWEVPKLAGDSNLKLVDSIHVMSAVFCGCDGFLTNDKAIGSDKLNIMLLSELDD